MDLSKLVTTDEDGVPGCTIAIVDFECFCVPLPPGIPEVCEVAVVLIAVHPDQLTRGATKVTQMEQFHALVRSQQLPHTEIDSKQIAFTSKRLLGIKYPQRAGISVAVAMRTIAPILQAADIVVANGPELEQRIFNRWGLGHIVVQDIHNWLRTSLKLRKSRPAECHEAARNHKCSAHSATCPDAHCALMDVFECVEWIKLVGLQWFVEPKTCM